MWRIGMIALLLAHGLIHLIGFVVPWKIAAPEGFSYKTTILAGRLDLGDGGIRFVGVLWLLATVVFVLAAVGLWTEQSGWGAGRLGRGPNPRGGRGALPGRTPVQATSADRELHLGQVVGRVGGLLRI